MSSNLNINNQVDHVEEREEDHKQTISSNNNETNAVAAASSVPVTPNLEKGVTTENLSLEASLASSRKKSKIEIKLRKRSEGCSKVVETRNNQPSVNENTSGRDSRRPLSRESRKRSGACDSFEQSLKSFVFLPTFALPVATTCHNNLHGCSNKFKHCRGSHSNSNKNISTSCFNPRFLVTIAPPFSRCCCCRRRREIRRVKENQDVRKTSESTPSRRNYNSKHSNANFTSMTRLEQSHQMKHEKSSSFLYNNNQPTENAKEDKRGEIPEKELTMESSRVRSGSKRLKKSKRRHRSPSSSSGSTALSRASAVGEANNISRQSSKKHKKSAKAKKSKRNRHRASKEEDSRNRKAEKSSKKKKKKRRYRSGTPKRKKVKTTSADREVVPCCCHSCPSSNEEDDRDMETPPRHQDTSIQLFAPDGALVSLPDSCKLPTLNLEHLTNSATKVTPLGMFCLQVRENRVDKPEVAEENNKLPVKAKTTQDDCDEQEGQRCGNITVDAESSPKKSNGVKEGTSSQKKENGNTLVLNWSPSRSSLGSKSKSRSCTHSRSPSRSLSRSKSRSKHYDSSPEILSNRDSRSRSSSRSASVSMRSFSSWSNSSSNSRSSSRSRSRSGSYSSRSRSRSGSNTSKSRNNSRSNSRSKSRSHTRSRTKSRSGSRSITRSRSRSRSISIPRRRGSPSFLDRRRITSSCSFYLQALLLAKDQFRIRGKPGLNGNLKQNIWSLKHKECY
ncbi:unnamed protein product [Allacma fusca]|uniref:Serine/arginine repetitive matrix protein C-terminal domain-containing protein n=1 Tax=Allacma fusca TaxID=39272 RepID=A0A8J2NT15_9HEXA|nr:unnamed protein product [Allacma fusca]